MLKSIRESARIIATDSDETPEAARHKIRSGLNQLNVGAVRPPDQPPETIKEKPKSNEIKRNVGGMVKNEIGTNVPKKTERDSPEKTIDISNEGDMVKMLKS